MSKIVLEQPETEKIGSEIAPVVADAQQMMVTSVEDHGLAQEVLVKLGRAEKQVKELFKDPKDAAHKAHKAITTAEKKLLTPIIIAKGIISGKLDVYEAAERKRAEAERLRLEELARKEEEDRQQAEALEAEKAGDSAQAEAILNEPVSVPQIEVKTETAKVEGISKAVRWKAEVTDKLALVKWVAKNKGMLSLLEPSMPNLNRMATMQKEEMSIPGVKAVPVATRRIGG